MPEWSPAHQDRIITLNNDTIECRINRVTRSEIHFDVNTNGVITSGTIPLAGILSYSINPSATENRKANPAVNGSFPRLRVTLSGGAGYLYSSSEKAEESMVLWGLSQERAEAYYKDLRTGFYGSGDIAWMFTPRLGAGIRYKFFDTSASTEGFFDPLDGMYLFYTTYSERIYVNFVGASVLYSEPLGAREKIRVSCSLSAGLALYRNEAELFQGNFLATGNSFGMDGAVGLEYHITPAVAFGAELSSFFSQLRKFEITDGSTTETMELEDDDIESRQITAEYDIDCIPYDIVPGENGWCYITPVSDQWVMLRNLNLATGEVITSTTATVIYEKTVIRKIPGKPVMAGSQLGVSPSSLLLFDLSGGQAKDDITRYHESIGHFWLSKDGARLYSAFRNVYTIPEYDGQFHSDSPPLYGNIGSDLPYINALDECPTISSIFVSSTNYFYLSGTSSLIEQFHTTSLNKIKRFNVSPVWLNPSGTEYLYQTAPRFIFINKEGTALYVIKTLQQDFESDNWFMETIEL